MTVYGIILAIFFIPVGFFKFDGQEALQATYVVNEEEISPLRKHRKKVFKALGKVGSSLTRAKVDVLCLDIALELMELSYEAYYDPTDHPTDSGFGIMNLERHGYRLLDSKYYPELDVFCYISRSISKNRVIVAFRGTSSKKHWNSNLDYRQVEINIEKDYQLPQLDEIDGMASNNLEFLNGSFFLLYLSLGTCKAVTPCIFSGYFDTEQNNLPDFDDSDEESIHSFKKSTPGLFEVIRIFLSIAYLY